MAILKGGQGRSVDDVKNNGTTFGWVLLLIALFAFSAMACHGPWKWNEKDIKRDRQVQSYEGPR
jgi:hypothetical protein